jgi:hypothetical protein
MHILLPSNYCGDQRKGCRLSYLWKSMREASETSEGSSCNQWGRLWKSVIFTEILVCQNEPFSDQNVTDFFSDFTDFPRNSHWKFANDSLKISGISSHSVCKKEDLDRSHHQGQTHTVLGGSQHDKRREAPCKWFVAWATGNFARYFSTSSLLRS